MISSLTSDVKDKLKRLLTLNPVEHAYPIWHLEFKNEMCKWFLWLKDLTPQCYMLIYEGFKEPDVHLRSLVDEVNIEDKLKELLTKLNHSKFVLHMRKEHFNNISDALASMDVRGIYGVKVMECVKPRIADHEGVVELKPMDWSMLVDIMSEVLKARGVKYASPHLEAYNYLTSYRTFAAIREGRAIAMASIVASTPHVAVIGNVYTLKSFRGMGYGKAVTSRALAEALKLSSRVVVWVREDNINAIKLYEGLGLKHVIYDVWVNVGGIFNP
ncbi:MAG: GNAT family N-acetyltransferase [Candidatus Nezhaarchaeales archaeon]